MSQHSRLKYTSIKQLQQRSDIDYTGKKPNHVVTRLSGMHDRAISAMKLGDEEEAYIYFKRWMDSVEWLKTTQEYKKDTAFYTAHIHSNLINQVKNTLADLFPKLMIRYGQIINTEPHKDNTSDRMNLEFDSSTQIHSHGFDLSLSLPETPTDDPLNNGSEEFMSCDELFHHVQKQNNRILIIDIRPKQQFQTSKMSFDRCVNIPYSEIIKGKTVSHFEKYLSKDKKSSEIFRYRGAQYVDVVVMFDWNTTENTLTSNNSLTVLKAILECWDPGEKYKRIVVLNGGYMEWLARYPAFTTNPKITLPEETEDTNDDMILEDIEYPEWLTEIPDNEENIKKLKKINKLDSVNEDIRIAKVVTKQPSKHKPEEIIEPSNLNNSSEHLANYKIVDNKYNQHKDNNSALHTLSNMPQGEMIVKPIVDRTSKPFSLKTNDTYAVLQLFEQLTELTNKEETLEQKILELENSLCMQPDINYKDSTEAQLKQDLLDKLQETKRLIHGIENKLNLHKPIQFNATEKTLKDKLDLNLRSTRSRLKNINAERKKIETSMNNQQQDTVMKPMDHNIEKESLKMNDLAINTGLERSYSSPNLSQLTDRKAPQVDRSSKPSTMMHNENGCIMNGVTSISRLSSGNREERMAPIHGNVHPGTTGLKNLGNSCYMNSIMQCLSNTTYLTKYFTDNSYTDDLSTNTENITQCQVVEEVAHVIKALWRGQYKSISPHHLKVAIGKYKSQFESYEQQDSHEFLTFLLDWMHNVLKKRVKIKSQSNINTVEKEWDKAMDFHKSVISDLFFGQLKSTITCAFCNEASTTYEVFNSLTMSLPLSNRCTLNDCIVKFVSGQKVVGWKCPKCEVPRDATKKFDFVKLAPIVVIHLNRFAESGGWLEKKSIAVDFPLIEFNLKPHLITHNDNIRLSNNIVNHSYNLYAMSNHYGTMEGGHYTAFCKNSGQNKWYKYDDHTVTEVSSNQVKSQNTSAYLLFYSAFPNTFI